MKILSVVLGIVIVFTGCQHTGPIELINEQDNSQFIEIMSVGNPSDTVFSTSGVDSAGLLNPNYFGRMMFADVYYSLPLRADSFIQLEAMFLDKSKPIQYNGHLLGYPSYDVGTLMFDDDTIPRLQRRLRMGSLGDTSIGYRYLLRKQHQNGQIFRYNWRVLGNGSFGPLNTFAPTVQEMRVLEYIPSFVPANGPLTFRWRCTNEYVHLYISREGELFQRSWVPILHLRIRNVNGTIELPAKVLDILPKKHYRHFLFTFSSEAESVVTMHGYQEQILLHTASIHNIILNTEL